MANPTLLKSHQIDILRHNGTVYEIVCGITSYDFDQTRSIRETLIRDCATNFATPTRKRLPGIIDASFSGSGKLDADYRQEFKTAFESAVSVLYKVAVEGVGTFVAYWVMDNLKLTSDAIDEGGYIDVSFSLKLDGALTWTND